MKRLAVALLVAAAAVAGVAWWPREPAEVATTPERPRVLARAEAAPAAAPTPAGSPAGVKLDELRTMSESVRNSTFVIAIRAAGFMCEDVVDIYADHDATTASAHHMTVGSGRADSHRRQVVDAEIARRDALLIHRGGDFEAHTTIQAAQLLDARQEPMFRHSFGHRNLDYGRSLGNPRTQIAMKRLKCSEHIPGGAPQILSFLR